MIRLTMLSYLCAGITLTCSCQTVVSQTHDEIVKQSSGAIAEWVLEEFTPNSDEAIEWLTDMQQGYDKSNSKNLPLVILMSCENLPECRKLEERTIISRQFNLFRNQAVFVRINVSAANLSPSTQEFVTITDAKEVPLLDFMEGDRVCHGSILGNKPTAEYIREVRRKLITINIAKRSGNKVKCTDAEFMRGVQTYMFATDALKKKEDDAFEKRSIILNSLRDKGQFQITEFLATEKALGEIQSQLRDKLLVLAELNSPVIQEYCAALLQLDSTFRDSDYLLRRDLIGVTVNGKFLEEAAIDIAKSMLDQSRKALRVEEDILGERVNASGEALEDRFNQVLQQDEPQTDKPK